jgi:hypothetical protein
MHATGQAEISQAYRESAIGSVPAPKTNPLTGVASSLPSRAQFTARMIYSPILRRLSLIVSFFCVTSFSEAAEKSLYNRETAKKIDISKLSILGPRASRFRYDKRLVKAAEIAAERARSRSRKLCWRYVKDALLEAGLVDTRPDTGYAKQAAHELTSEYGFRKIKVTDPYKAPIGSVLVYGGRGAGHVEFRTKKGFVSDFVSLKPSSRPLIGVFVK